MLSNIYLSEKGKRNFRSSHHNLPALPDPRGFLNNAQNVNLKPRDLIANFKRRQADRSTAILRTFRPIARRSIRCANITRNNKTSGPDGLPASGGPDEASTVAKATYRHLSVCPGTLLNQLN